MKILIPTDFSKCAENAIRYGLEIAARADASVTLLHVMYPYQDLNSNVYEALWLDKYIQQKHTALKRLAARFRRNASFTKVPIETHVGIGFPTPIICQYANQMEADLIVMGSTGASNLASMFLGSNTASVLGRTQKPVLSVPRKSKYYNHSTAVFATDFDFKVDDDAIRLLHKIMAAHQAKVKILHILDRAGVKPDPTKEALVSQKMLGIQHTFHYLHDEDVPQAISNFIEATEAQLLVSVSHDHNLLQRLFQESVSKTLAHRVHIPMLVLHDA